MTDRQDLLKEYRKLSQRINKRTLRLERLLGEEGYEAEDMYVYVRAQKLSAERRGMEEEDIQKGKRLPIPETVPKYMSNDELKKWVKKLNTLDKAEMSRPAAREVIETAREAKSSLQRMIDMGSEQAAKYASKAGITLDEVADIFAAEREKKYREILKDLGSKQLVDIYIDINKNPKVKFEDVLEMYIATVTTTKFADWFYASKDVQELLYKKDDE